jgi:hypothetical protein
MSVGESASVPTGSGGSLGAMGAPPLCGPKAIGTLLL